MNILQQRTKQPLCVGPTAAVPAAESTLVATEPTQSSRGRERHCLALLCIVFVLVQVHTAWRWGLPAYRSCAVDSIGGFQILGFAKGGMRYQPGFDASYPPMHKYILSAAYAPLAVYWASRGTLHELENRPPVEQVPARTLLLRLGRLVTIAMATALLVVLFMIGRRLAGEIAGLLAAGLWSGTYLAGYYGLTANIDVPYIFWLTLSLERLVAHNQRFSRRSILAGAVFAAFAVATKDQAAAVVAAYPLLLVWRPFASSDAPARTLHASWSHAVLWCIVASLAYGVVSQAFLRPANYFKHIEALFGPALRPVQLDLSASQITLAYAREFLCVAHPLLLLLVAGGALSLVVQSPRIFLGLMLPVLTYHAGFLIQANILAARFLLPHVTLLALAAGVGVGLLAERRSGSARRIVRVATFLAYASGLSLTVLLCLDPRDAAQRWLLNRPDVVASLGWHQGSYAYAPAAAQVHAKRMAPTQDGRPSDVDARYLICVSAYYARWLEHDSAVARAWTDLLEGHAAVEPLIDFTPPTLPFPWSPINHCRPDIPGLAQTVKIMKRKPPPTSTPEL